MTRYEIGETGTCPHCQVVVVFTGDEEYSTFQVTKSRLESGSLVVGEPLYQITGANCPNCGKQIIALEIGFTGPHSTRSGPVGASQYCLLWPRSAARPIAPQVPGAIASDYREAAEVLSISPKASAALSRRCLQSVLREAGNAMQSDLSKQIDFVMQNLPADLAIQIDAIRHYGNFAAHPLKSQSSGLVLDVEPGEAEWTLDVLDLLFEYYYVRPARALSKRAALDAKLKDAGKPPMK